MANKIVQLKDGSDNVYPSTIITSRDVLYNLTDEQAQDLSDFCIFSMYNNAKVGNAWFIGLNIPTILNYESSYKLQFGVNLSNNKIYVRSKYANNWIDWQLKS